MIWQTGVNDVLMEMKKIMQHVVRKRRNILNSEDEATNKCVFMKVKVVHRRL
jgi:hypothetical protein